MLLHNVCNPNQYNSLTVNTVATMEYQKKAVSLRTDSTSRLYFSVCSVLSKLLLISKYVYHKQDVPPILATANPIMIKYEMIWARQCKIVMVNREITTKIAVLNMCLNKRLEKKSVLSTKLEHKLRLLNPREDSNF